MASTKISALTEASSLNASDAIPVVQNSTTKKVPFSTIANYILNSYTLSLGAVTQTVKAAIDAIQTKIGTASMGTTATTITGAIAEVRTSVANIGDVVSADYSTTELPNGTATPLCSASFAAGTWVIRGHINFQNGGSSVTYRRVVIEKSDGSSSYGYVQSASSPVGITCLECVVIVSFSSTTTVRLVGQQGSGSSISASARTNALRGVRIR